MLSSQFKRKFWEIFAFNPRLCKTRFKKLLELKKIDWIKRIFMKTARKRRKNVIITSLARKKNPCQMSPKKFFFSSLFLSSFCEISPNFSKKFPNTHYFSAKAICSCASAIFDIVRVYILIDKKWLENKNVDFSVQQWNEKKSIIFLHSLFIGKFQVESSITWFYLDFWDKHLMHNILFGCWNLFTINLITKLHKADFLVIFLN